MAKRNSIPYLLVTANVGSVFEDPLRLLKTWIDEFLAKVAGEAPQFLALHLQEVGGKTYQKSIENVHSFVKQLCESKELYDYGRIRMFLDEDFNSAENFTALGNLYFVHKSVKNARIWNFEKHEWEKVEGICIHTGDIESVATKEKSKFPQHFFPECKWSRKGFLRTRWEINSTIVDFVNIHLFHDASNLVACENFPSVYCKTRRRALVHTLERFHKDVSNGIAPYFVFGDFNFRCDTKGIIKKLTGNLSEHNLQNIKKDDSKKEYKNEDGRNVLTIGKKEFSFDDHDEKYGEMWLQEFDRELEPFHDVLIEYPIAFRPSYPYEEDPDQPNKYMSTRCPSWCDRILMSPLAKDLSDECKSSATDYNVIGENVCMGDHKPVYLKIYLKSQQDNYEPLPAVSHDLDKLITSTLGDTVSRSYKEVCSKCDDRKASSELGEEFEIENAFDPETSHESETVCPTDETSLDQPNLFESCESSKKQSDIYQTPALLKETTV